MDGGDIRSCPYSKCLQGYEVFETAELCNTTSPYALTGAVLERIEMK